MAKKIIAIARSPLAEQDAIKRDAYQQHEIFPLGKIILRGKDGDDAFAQAVKNTLGAELPRTPNTVIKTNDASLLWLGAEEWLLWTEEKKRQQQLSQLQTAFAQLHAAAVDVSDYYTLIRLSGQVKPVLAHGCPLDFRDKAFPVGACAQSHYRNAAIVLYRADDKIYDVQIRRSFARYLWEYFAQVSQQLYPSGNAA